MESIRVSVHVSVCVQVNSGLSQVPLVSRTTHVRRKATKFACDVIPDIPSYHNLNTFIFVSYHISEDTLDLRHMALVLFLFYLAGNELASSHLFFISQFNKTPTHRCRVLL